MAYSKLSQAFIYGHAGACAWCGTDQTNRRFVVSAGVEPVIVWACEESHAKDFWINGN
jgi:hypothetical protein